MGLSTTPRRVPRLRFRPTVPTDLSECFELLPAWLTLSADERAQLPALWARLLDEPSITSTVMEDLAQPPGRRIQGWGSGLIVPPLWVDRLGLAGAPRSHVIDRIYRALLDGALPLLDDREIGAANAGGQLHFLNLHYTQRASDLSDDYALAVLNIANEAFRVAASGYRLQGLYFESSARDGAMIASAGFPHVPYVNEVEIAALPADRRPMFFGISREQARAGLPGTSVRHAFEHHPPRFRLSLAQRRLLWLALFDESDDALMARLGVSVHGLKKLWRGIYERIEDAAPEFFGFDESERGADKGKRGPEKRRQVLAYVRQRPEELRAWG